MNYNKVIKDLKERNNNLQEQYRLRDIRCIHLEYENEMLKSDFETQHELTKKYAEENQQLKESLHQASIGIQELIEQDIECPSNCSKLKDLDKIEKSFIEIKNQQKEFIEYLTSYIDLLSNKPDLIEEAEIDILEEILSKYKSIIGGKE